MTRPETERRQDDIVVSFLREMHDDLKERVGKTEGKVDSLTTDVAGLKVKAGIWGALAGVVGSIPALGAGILLLVKSLGGKH